jgi:hypothetical protein
MLYAAVTFYILEIARIAKYIGFIKRTSPATWSSRILLRSFAVVNGLLLRHVVLGVRSIIRRW